MCVHSGSRKHCSAFEYDSNSNEKARAEKRWRQQTAASAVAVTETVLYNIAWIHH